MKPTKVEINQKSRIKNNVKQISFELRREEVNILSLLKDGETAPQLAKRLFFNEMEKRK